MDCSKTRNNIHMILLFIVIGLCQSKLQDGYAFLVYTTELCPRNKKEWKERSVALNCNESNAFMCLPNENFTELLEFCYKKSRIRIQEGICLFLYKKYSLVDAYNCQSFTHGCPNISHFSDEIFKYPSCLSLGDGCFLSEPSCTSALPVPVLGGYGHVRVVIPLIILLVISLIILIVVLYRYRVRMGLCRGTPTDTVPQHDMSERSPLDKSKVSELAILEQVDGLFIKQKALTGYKTKNHYEICNSVGQSVYRVVEDNWCCNRKCCGRARPFSMRILNDQNQEVIHLSRPLRCSSWWCPCYLQNVVVEAPPGMIVGYVCQFWSLCKPGMRIKNATEEIVLSIKGSGCQVNICGDINFDIYDCVEKRVIGHITNQNVIKEDKNYTSRISFPRDLDVKVKATLLGAMFLLDFMFFE